jgi:hypothetical protein
LIIIRIYSKVKNVRRGFAAYNSTRFFSSFLSMADIVKFPKPYISIKEAQIPNAFGVVY